VTYVPEKLRIEVRDRANGLREYCLVHEDHAYLPHEIDHIYAEKHGGDTVEQNLCYCCYWCNRFEGSDLSSIDPVSDEVVPLFHPSRDTWASHFQLDGSIVKPVTATGRVTVNLLRINSSERVKERQKLIESGNYPRE